MKAVKRALSASSIDAAEENEGPEREGRSPVIWLLLVLVLAIAGVVAATFLLR